MGLIQALGYEVPEPNAAQRAMWHVSSSRPGAWMFAKSGPYLDRFLLRLSHGQVTLAKLVAGIPVITIVTTGARTGQTRTTPLLGVPFAGDLAVIGKRFRDSHANRCTDRRGQTDKKCAASTVRKTSCGK